MIPLRKLALWFMATGVLGAIPFVIPASASPGQVCHLPTYGGDYYCDYGSHIYPLSSTTQQVFVIDTNFGVTTRWITNGKLSSWVNLGGPIRKSWNKNGFELQTCKDHPFVVIYRSDNLRYYRYRQSSGTWTA